MRNNNNFEYLLSELISYQSVTPNDNGCLQYLVELLSNHGFKVDLEYFGDDYKVGNLYAQYGNNSPNICFAGHIDVVTPGDLAKWDHDPFQATLKDNRIFGRGAVDMKGAIACQLAACIDFLEKNPQPKGSISFLITSDEEGEAKYGTKMMLEHIQKQGVKLDFAIVGEPTTDSIIGDTIKIGRRGSISFKLTLEGKQGHVAYPELADNPVHKIVEILHNLRAEPLDAGSKFFDSSNLEITSIDVGNKVGNVIPNVAKACFNVRFNDLHQPQDLIDKVTKVVSEHAARYVLESNISAHCFIQKPNEFIARFKELVAEATGVQAKFSTSGGTSDARFIKDYCPLVEFGLPSNMAHKINEFAEIKDLQSLYNVYYMTLNKFLG